MYKRLQIEQKINIKALYTLFSDTREPNYRFEGERHNFWEVVFVLNGKVGITSEKELFTVNENQVVFHTPMEFHNIWSENSTNTVFIFSFDGDMPQLDYNVFSFGAQERIIINEIMEMYPKVFKCHDIHIRKINNGMENEAEIIIKKLELLISSVLRNSQTTILDLDSKSAQNYLNIVATLNKNINKNLTIGEIADKCSMSPSNLKKTFRKYSGMSIIKFFNELKIEKAQKLLKEGFSVKETANTLGYNDQNYFSVVFKRITGYSPVKYKNKN